MTNEKYVIHTICTGNSCRSRMAQGKIQSIAIDLNLEDRIEARSSGILVDKIKNWGVTEELPLKTILKVLRAAYNNGIHAMTQYRGLVEGVLADEDAATEKHNNDDLYRQELNRAASEVYRLVEEFDKASTMLVMAEHGLVYPHGKARQFSEDGSDLYVSMEEKHVEKVQAKVSDPQRVKCIDEFTPGMKLKGSLAAICYSDGKLHLDGFREIYNQIETGCCNLMEFVKNAGAYFT